ncbi:MAG: hypothetical protein KDI60_17400 [Xanthomonadales bacterium]|nr:hypothetical protein [Xanthomonadales bacterium]
MSNLAILSLQYLVALGTYIVIFRVYLQPWFKAQPFGKAVLPLLLLHAFRYLGLTLMVPGQIDESIAFGALQIMAWGDFASGVSALLAAVAVHHRWSSATALVALFSLIGIGDLIVVGHTAINAGVFFADIGTMWFLLVLYAPAMLLAQIYIAYRLVNHLRGQ